MNKVVQSTVQFILALGISSKAGYVSLVCSIALHLSTVTLFHMVHLEAFSKSNELHTHLFGQACPGELKYKVGCPKRICQMSASEDLLQLFCLSDVQFVTIQRYPVRSQSNDNMSGVTATKVDVIDIMQVGITIRLWITLW